MSLIVGSFDAKNQFSKILGAVAKGERVTVTKHGVPIAQIVPVASSGAISADEAVEQMLELSKSITLGDGLTIRDVIEEGRR